MIIGKVIYYIINFFFLLNCDVYIRKYVQSHKYHYIFITQVVVLWLSQLNFNSTSTKMGLWYILWVEQFSVEIHDVRVHIHVVSVFMVRNRQKPTVCLLASFSSDSLGIFRPQVSKGLGHTVIIVLAFWQESWGVWNVGRPFPVNEWRHSMRLVGSFLPRGHERGSRIHIAFSPAKSVFVPSLAYLLQYLEIVKVQQ